MRNPLSLLAVPMILAALAVGCGDDNTTTPSTPTSPGSPTNPGTPNTPDPGTPLPAGSVAITIMGVQGVNSFFPSTATVQKGQLIEWRNTDNQSHELVSDTDAFETGTIKSGTTSSTLRISGAGTYHYHCTEHPKMVGSIVVMP